MSLFETHRIDVPGGWIYHGRPLGLPVYVRDPAVWSPNGTNAGSILAAIADIKQELLTMSSTLSSQIDAATAELQGDLATITAGVKNLEAELAAAIAGVASGSVVTQAQVEALTAVHTSLASLAASIPVPPAATTLAA